MIRLLSTPLLALILAVFVANPALARSAHDFDFVSIEGQPLSMVDYAGRPVLVVNTASFCGFTYQYEHLQTLWEGYRERGLVVLGVPSDNFGNQEYGSNAEVKTFCETTFGIDFPMTEKQDVRGQGAHPLYQWFHSELGAAGTPRWNFHKVLVDPQGRPVAGWPSAVKPTDRQITQAIEAMLAE